MSSEEVDRILNLLQPFNADSRILDLGCGESYAGMVTLYDKLKAASYVGVDLGETDKGFADNWENHIANELDPMLRECDYSLPALKHATKNHLQNFRFEWMDVRAFLNALGDQERFDLIILWNFLHLPEVFEHRREIIDLCWEKCASGGVVTFKVFTKSSGDRHSFTELELRELINGRPCNRDIDKQGWVKAELALRKP